MVHVTKKESGVRLLLRKVASTVTLTCLLAMVAAVQGDEPATPPAEAQRTTAAATAAPVTNAEASSASDVKAWSNTTQTDAQPKPASPRMIIIETTPNVERSEIIGKVVEALEEDGIAQRSDEKRVGERGDVHAFIVAQVDLPGEKIRKLVETLKALSIGRASIQVGPIDRGSSVIVTCPADVTFQRVRTLHEGLAKQEDFKVDVRVATNNGPVTSTGPTMFQLPQPKLRRVEDSSLPPGAIDDNSAGAQPGRPGSGVAGGFGGAGAVALGLPASAIPGRKWVAGTKVIVTFSDDGQQVLAYSEQHPRWVAQDLEHVADTQPLPVVGGEGAVAVRVGHLFYAYSATLGKWDVLKLPPGEAAVPVVGDDGVNVHSASQGDFVFRNSWGKWFSTDEIKAGRVAEHLLAQRATAPAGQAEGMTLGEVSVFQLKYAQATEAARIVRQLSGGEVSPAVEERTNSLLVAGAGPLAVKRVAELLKVIDTAARKSQAAPQPVQSIDELSKLYKELDRRTHELAARLRGPSQNPVGAQQWREDLRETVRQAFEARQQLQRAELAELTQRLQVIQQSVETRDRISQQIIDRRVEELLDPNLRWESDTEDQ